MLCYIQAMSRASNITVAPLEQAKAVKSPAIDEVLDLDTGEFLNAEHFIERHLFRKRPANLALRPFR